MNRRASDPVSFGWFRNFQKTASAALIFTALLVFPFTALAHSYTVVYQFDTNLWGQTRYYDGNNIELILKSTAIPGGANNYFKVNLYKDGFWSDTLMGTGYAFRDGTTTVHFSNVGPGNYYTHFSKAYDGIYVVGTGTFQNY